MNNELKETALKYIDANLSVIPIIGKFPALRSWKEYQNRLPTQDEISTWFENESITGLAMLCNKDVLAIDFDDMDMYEQWRKDIGETADGLPEQKSGKGRHIAFRSEKNYGTCKLAMIPDETKENGERVGIELRGPGAYIMVAPSKHIKDDGEYDCYYENIDGNFYDLPEISSETTTELLITAKALNQVIKKKKDTKQVKSNGIYQPSTAETEFNNKYSIEDVLIRNNYEPHPTDPIKFRSPTSNSPPGTYGVNILDNGICFSHHTSDPLYGNEMDENGEVSTRKHNAFSAFKVLEHDGDFKKACAAANSELGLKTLTYKPKKTSVSDESPTNLPRLIDYDLMAKEFDPLKFIIPKYLPEGLFILAGKQKIGKSWLALDMCLAVATGGTVLSEKVEQGRAIYFALEDGARRLQDRLHKLGVGSNQPDLLTLAEMGSLPPLNKGGYKLLENLLDHYPDTRLLVIDTLGMIKPPTSNKNAYEEDVKSMAPLREMAKKYGISLVLVTHVRKTEANDTFDEVHGSVGLTGTADGTIKLNRERISKTATMDITGRDIQEVSMALNFNEDTFKWEVVGDADAVELTNEQKRIAEVLEESPEGQTPTQIGNILGKSRGSVSNILRRMMKEGMVNNDGGKYKMNTIKLLFDVKGDG